MKDTVGVYMLLYYKKRKQETMPWLFQKRIKDQSVFKDTFHHQ